jgi:hypothetical protein
MTNKYMNFLISAKQCNTWQADFQKSCIRLKSYIMNYIHLVYSHQIPVRTRPKMCKSNPG